MAQWIETREPYIDVIERVHQAALNPVAGESLIIGITLISDAGPATPTLISSQSEFLSTYSSGDLTEDYINSLNNLYYDANNTGDPTVAATMFKVLSDNQINIKMISTSEIKVSCIIEEKFTELAVRVLHSAFITEKQDG